ncbi:MAG: phospholipase D-like domain-containing protein [Nanoarchaeota archaeon]|nr:phospholipase D-like domain-containing protein [Nanoarchaeota archaeon]MCG2720204.1 phospholipase D-like domain-containing protein [Nanoarchaeota archaeon]
MTSDLTFITNEGGKSLLQRFTTLIKDTRYFDCLVGYFYASGFYSIYKSLEKTEKIRVLIGISTDKATFELLSESKQEVQETLPSSTKETKEQFTSQIVQEMESSKDSYDIEEGIHKFIEWLRSGKLEIKVYPADTIHAKLYIMTFKEGDRDVGRVITGSSNFTKSGLRDNIEFNVELKNRSDYEFSLKKFNELWENAVDVSEKYVETIKNKTWLNDEITPYELYLKFLYEFLKEKINIDKEDIFKDYLPENFMDLKYQKDAVIDAKIKLGEYGGVFISDVVGLGKTFVSAMLALQLDGGTLVIAPPTLLDKDNPGSWRNVFFEFGVRQADFESIGMLDKIIQRGTEKYKNIIIDEAHRFRTESTQMYEKLFEICRNKRVILVSATPLNNTPLDILSQIKLFQNAHKSTLPSPKVRDLEKYFKKLQNNLKGLDRQTDKDEYLRIIKENAEDIRENVLHHLMVRRTRNNISKYYGKDLETQGLKFPDVADPEPIVYHFNEELDKIFNKTLELIIKKFKYARYTPLLYLKEGVSQPEEISQKNMGKFMKILLLKRLESSFFAFKMSVNRFIHSYKRFIEEYKNGRVYVSKKHINKIFEFLEDDDRESIQELIENEKASEYSSKDFLPHFIKDLEHDFKLLEEIEGMWKNVNEDPKLDEFIKRLSKEKILKEHKLLVFTESKETADYLYSKLNTPKFDNKVMAFSSNSSASDRLRTIENYDANYPKHKQKDDVRILISTDILSEGVSLHRSNVVINYDLPWNPIRMMQRVGRVNRVSKNPPYSTIYTYNFFPAGPINKEISLTEAAESKIKAFIEMLGNDAKLLTNEEVKSHDLFTKLTSKKIITGEDEEDDPELRYLTFLREIRDKNPDLFEKIKKLPKKARTAKKYSSSVNSALTFFRKGKLRKIFMTNGSIVDEVDFIKAAEILESEKELKREKLDAEFYKHLELNKKEFDAVFIQEENEPKASGGRSQEGKLIKIIKAIIKAKEFTDEDEEYLQEVLRLLKEGGIAKATIKRIVEEIGNEINPLKILAKIKAGISPSVFQGTFTKNSADIAGPKEVILSEYLIKNG